MILYTDGSCSPNPGPGGFAVIEGDKPVVLGQEKDSTNIRMEGEALIAAMKHADGKECEIHTDSEFWIKVITEWAPGWEAKGWKKSSKGEIQNLDLVKEAYYLHKSLLEARPLAEGKSVVRLVWVKAHVGHDGNELADEWANKARKGAKLVR